VAAGVAVAAVAAGAAAVAVTALTPDVMQKYTLDAEEGTGPVEERIIEYERKLPFKEFASRHLFPNEPQFKRGDGSGLALLSKEDLLLPAGWTWLDGQPRVDTKEMFEDRTNDEKKQDQEDTCCADPVSE
jgi:hypothetical protein